MVLFLIPAMTSLGWTPLTVHPTDVQVPKHSRTVPNKSFARDRSRSLKSFATPTISSRETFPLCLTVKFYNIHTPKRMTKDK
jgi:hypothetical protein